MVSGDASFGSNASGTFVVVVSTEIFSNNRLLGLSGVSSGGDLRVPICGVC